MSDIFWRSFAAATRSLAMVPSLLHSVAPSPPQLSKCLQDVVQNPKSPSSASSASLLPPPATPPSATNASSLDSSSHTTSTSMSSSPRSSDSQEEHIDVDGARRSVPPALSRTMHDFLREVRDEFEASITTDGLFEMSRKLEAQFKTKLQAGENCMLPSFNHTLPTGREQGTYLCLDLGGSCLRIAAVQLNGVGNIDGCRGMSIIRMRSIPIGNAARALEGHAFFDWMAQRIRETLEEPELRHICSAKAVSLGMAWSFPVEQTSEKTYRLLEMGKGFRATVGVLGHDLGELVMQACRRQNINVKVEAIVNDSSATLLSRAYQDQSTRVALILGTGTNAAVHLPVSALAPRKFGVRPQSWHDRATHVLVNTEFSMFGKNVLPVTRWDEELNRNHSMPDFQPLEYLVSGRYLGEIVRLVLVEAVQTAGLFDGEIPSSLSEPYSLDTATLAAIEADDSSAMSSAVAVLHAAHPLTSGKKPLAADILFVRRITRSVTLRATAYLAAGVHALWSLHMTSESLTPATVAPMSIGCNGTVMELYPGYRSSTQRYLDLLTAISGAQGRCIVLDVAEESAIFGAAVAVAAAKIQKREAVLNGV